MDYKISNEDRLFLYLWYEVGAESEPTLGQHWVSAGIDPMSDAKKELEHLWANLSLNMMMIRLK
jgi:hypothetical protein